MESTEPIDACEFISVVQPLLERRDCDGLYSLLKARWTPEQIMATLAGPHRDGRKVAALCLGLVGQGCCVPYLAKCLRDDDSCVREMAEHALWSVWFRLGTPDANQQLARGAQALGRREYDCAIRHFDNAAQNSPRFAEAYNQRALANYLRERYEDSLADCGRAAELMPCHFGAWAGMGHCHAHVGRRVEAIEAYERALDIHPYLECVQQAVRELKRRR